MVPREEREMSNRKIRMARLCKIAEQDRSFDREFWSKVGAEVRFAAAWEMVAEYMAIRGADGSKSRLQRSVARIERIRG